MLWMSIWSIIILLPPHLVLLIWNESWNCWSLVVHENIIMLWLRLKPHPYWFTSFLIMHSKASTSVEWLTPLPPHLLFHICNTSFYSWSMLGNKWYHFALVEAQVPPRMITISIFLICKVFGIVHICCDWAYGCIITHYRHSCSIQFWKWAYILCGLYCSISKSFNFAWLRLKGNTVWFPNPCSSCSIDARCLPTFSYIYLSTVDGRWIHHNFFSTTHPVVFLIFYVWAETPGQFWAANDTNMLWLRGPHTYWFPYPPQTCLIGLTRTFNGCSLCFWLDG